MCVIANLYSKAYYVLSHWKWNIIKLNSLLNVTSLDIKSSLENLTSHLKFVTIVATLNGRWHVLCIASDLTLWVYGKTPYVPCACKTHAHNIKLNDIEN